MSRSASATPTHTHDPSSHDPLSHNSSSARSFSSPRNRHVTIMQPFCNRRPCALELIEQDLHLVTVLALLLLRDDVRSTLIRDSGAVGWWDGRMV